MVSKVFEIKSSFHLDLLFGTGLVHTTESCVTCHDTHLHCKSTIKILLKRSEMSAMHLGH